MIWRISCMAAACAAALSCPLPVCSQGLWAGEERAWHQFPEMPAVLYYEGFETSAPTWKNGKVDEATVQHPGNPHSYKLGDKKGSNEKTVIGTAEFPAKLPAGLDASDVHISFMLWTDEPGELSLKFKDGDFEEKPRIPKLKAWVPVTLRLSDTSKDKKRPPKDASFRAVELTLKPKDKKAASVFVDDFIITNGARPADVLRQVVALEARRGAVIRSADKDGFTFSPQIQESLQSTLKRCGAGKKPKTVLVVASRPKEAEDLIKDLSASAGKTKLAGFSFVAGTAPDGAPLCGLDDMRMLLPYSTRRTEAEMALLVLGQADTLKPGGRPGDAARAVLERTLEAGCVPILCLPPLAQNPPKGQKAKPDAFVNAVSNACVELAVPWVDEGFCGKGAAKAAAKREAAAADPEDGLAALAAQAIKHVDANVFGRK